MFPNIYKSLLVSAVFAALGSEVGAQCLPHEEATNAQSTALVRSNWIPREQMYISSLQAVVPTNDFTPIEELTRSHRAGRETVGRYLCNPSGQIFVNAYNEYGALANEGQRLRISHLKTIIENAEREFNKLESAKTVLASATNPTTYRAARANFDVSATNIRAFVIGNVTAPDFGVSFSASNFWLKVNNIIAEADSLPVPSSPVEIVVEEFSGSVLITTGNAIGNIEVRHLSFGPGICNVDTYSSLGGSITTNAPPVLWSEWQSINSVTASISVTLTAAINCETGVRSQVRYPK